MKSHLVVIYALEDGQRPSFKVLCVSRHEARILTKLCLFPIVSNILLIYRVRLIEVFKSVTFNYSGGRVQGPGKSLESLSKSVNMFNFFFQCASLLSLSPKVNSGCQVTVPVSMLS